MRLELLILSTIGVSACSGGYGAPAPPAPSAGGGDYESATVRAAATILPDDIRRHITFLANDDLAGRDTPSAGLEVAASYLVEFLEEAGLEPAGENGTFVQRFPYTRTAMVAAELQVSYRSAGSTRELDYARDYYVVPGAQSATNAEVVFGGVAARPSAGLARVANGKVALFTTAGNPMTGTGEDLLGAFQAAALGRASAVVLLLDETQTPDSIMAMANALQGAGLVAPLAVVVLSSESGAELLAEAGLDLAALRPSPPANAIPLDGVTMNVSAPFETSSHTPPNVVGMVRGSDPELRDEYIVYSAHFDHVGVGIANEAGDSIYNGADDNASGTAALIGDRGRVRCARRAAGPIRHLSGGERRGEGVAGLRVLLGKPDRPDRTDHHEHQHGHGGAEPPPRHGDRHRPAIHQPRTPHRSCPPRAPGPQDSR